MSYGVTAHPLPPSQNFALRGHLWVKAKKDKKKKKPSSLFNL